MLEIESFLGHRITVTYIKKIRKMEVEVKNEVKDEAVETKDQEKDEETSEEKYKDKEKEKEKEVEKEEKDDQKEVKKPKPKEPKYVGHLFVVSVQGYYCKLCPKFFKEVSVEKNKAFCRCIMHTEAF
ncbi:hypothetical protein TNCV_2050401 [Trichonephila clavipes]|nr:hypothetical protein TNCV_2050401 [Trichonephila clavipes]